MKSYWGLILLAISTAFGAGYYALFLQGSYIATDQDILKIRTYKQDFLDKTRPVSSINLRDYYPYFEQSPLITPALAIRASSKSSNIYSSSEYCSGSIPFSIDFGDFKKTLIWEEFRCGNQELLPPLFFTTPPYMHPSGKSYMYLAYKLNSQRFGDWGWLHSRIYFFHIQELFELAPNFPKIVTTPLGKILTLGEDMLYKMSQKASPLVHDNNIYLKKNQTFFSNEDLTYDIFPLTQLQKSLLKTEFSVRAREHGEHCFYDNQDLCWSYNFKYLFSIASKGSIFFFAFSILVIILALWLLFNKLRLQRLEDERRRLALQVLSHEFRTPVSSLLVTVESLFDSFDEMSEKMGEEVMRISSDVHRLHRLVELSRHYLKVSNGKRLVDLKKQRHPSFNQLIHTLLQRYEETITIIELEQDSPISIDEYWLGICLKNLVENALRHGKPPVVVTLSMTIKHYQISVSDQGEIPAQTHIEQLTQEFAKGSSSEGSGLGLNIVKKIIFDMKGELLLINKPTTFMIQIPIRK